MRNYFALLIILAVSCLILTSGCTGTNSEYSDKATPAPQDTTAAPTAENTNIQTPAETTEPTPSDSPKFNAGMIVTDNKNSLKLITVYDRDTQRYTTRTLFKGDKGNQNEAYLIKDGSFKELGISFDNYKTFDAKYPYLFDDLNINSDTELYYNYDKKEGNRIYIYTNGAVPNYVGYLAPDSPESMDFVNTNA
ncbi:MAG: hypothetical protein PHO78_06410 [Methanomicrobium sp.]|nr:hypothetical protein [Methanomicrobium sp.]